MQLFYLCLFRSFFFVYFTWILFLKWSHETWINQWFLKIPYKSNELYNYFFLSICWLVPLQLNGSLLLKWVLEFCFPFSSVSAGYLLMNRTIVFLKMGLTVIICESFIRFIGASELANIKVIWALADIQVIKQISQEFIRSV